MLQPRDVSLREEDETTSLLRRLLPCFVSCFEKNFARFGFGGGREDRMDIRIVRWTKDSIYVGSPLSSVMTRGFALMDLNKR